MNNLPSIFTGQAPTKTEIETQCKVIIDSIVESGEVNPIKVATSMKALELAMKTIKSGIEDMILSEAEKYESKTFEFDGHSINVREGGVMYDYSLCCDPVYGRLESEMKFLKDKIKDREAFLKTVKGSMTVVDEGSGEVFQVIPPVKSSKTTVAITLAK